MVFSTLSKRGWTLFDSVENDGVFYCFRAFFEVFFEVRVSFYDLSEPAIDDVNSGGSGSSDDGSGVHLQSPVQQRRS